MSFNHIHSDAYAQDHVQSHEGTATREYTNSYWNHIFLDSILNTGKQGVTHLLEEGGGVCGIWRLLSFDNYTSADISEPMTKAARQLHQGSPGKTFIQGDIFSDVLAPGAYSAIIANAFGVYYRPNSKHLKRLQELLAPGGLLFVAYDPVQNIKHFLADPFADLISKHARLYTRISTPKFLRMAEQAGLEQWMGIDYQPAPGWHRRAVILKNKE